MIMTNLTSNAPALFTAKYTPSLPELIQQLNCSIAITTYQAGKVVMISARDENSLSMLPRTFKRAMGMAQQDNRLAAATKNEVIAFSSTFGYW